MSPTHAGGHDPREQRDAALAMSQELEDHGLIKAGATDQLRNEFARRERT